MNFNNIIKETYDNNPLLRNILIKPMSEPNREAGLAERESELEKEFDKKYANGDFDDQMILDDDLPDFRENWIAENL